MRVVAGVVMMVVGIVGATWAQVGTITISREVRVRPSLEAGASASAPAGIATMRIACGRDASGYASESGAPMFFNVTSPERPEPFCDEIGRVRWVTTTGFLAVGLLGAALVVTRGAPDADTEADVGRGQRG